MKLFAFKQAPEDIPAPDLDKRYTRFPHRHTRAISEPVEAPHPQPCQAEIKRPERPVRIVQVEPEQSQSLADQLHTEAQIPISLLRRALPLRFADIDARTRDMAQAEVEELQSQPR